jgi:NAD(P)-dependent dehydrogenase (short-subunit alcohol dehydrogenase family)
MFKDLVGKTVIITGGNGFLGSQFSDAFLKNGSKVIVLDLKKNNKKKTKNFFYYNCDITKENNIKEVFTTIKKKFKKIDVLINNAAIDSVPVKKIKTRQNQLEKFDMNNWNREIEVGLTGALICTKYFGNHMSKQKNGGAILNISSDLGIVAPDQSIYKKTNFIKPVTYSVIKHGIIGLTKYTASYWGKQNVRCNTIAPGGMKSDKRKLNNNFIKDREKTIPLKRMASLNEYNDLVLFLCSKSSSYITGATISADGGRTII